MSQFTIRYAQDSDIPQILFFIKELATYEKMLDDVVATEDLLREWIFEKKKAEVILAEENSEPVGFALFFHNFSTFLGRAGIYLEDLFVKSEYRAKELARHSCEGWHKSPWSGAAAGWSGPVWAGINPALISIFLLVPCPWISGLSIASLGIPCAGWPMINCG